MGVGWAPTRPQGATDVSLLLPGGGGTHGVCKGRISGKSRLQHEHFRLKISLVVHVSNLSTGEVEASLGYMCLLSTSTSSTRLTVF